MSQPVNRSGRMYASLPEDLVSIDIADTGDQVLTQQQRLNGATTAMQHAVPARQSERGAERLEAQAGHGREFDVRRHQVHVAESSLINEAQVGSAELQDDAGVRVHRRGAWYEREVAGHAQMDDEWARTAQPDEQILAPAVDRAYTAAGQCPDKPALRRRTDRRRQSHAAHGDA